MIANKHEKVALQFNDGTLSYQQLKSNISHFHKLFNNQNISRIAIYSENQPAWIYAFYASWHNQSTVVPIDSLATIDEVSYILNDCFPEVCFVSQQKKNDLQSAIEKAGISTEIIVLEDVSLNTSISNETTPDLQYNDEDTAVIIYTSGTTGNPKGVMLSFANLMANIDAVSNQLPIFNHQEVVLMLLPLHHIFPLVGTLIAPLYVGATIAMAPSMAPEDVIQTLQKNKVSIIIGVPRFYSAIHKGILKKINESGIAKSLMSLAGVIKSKHFSRFIFKSIHKKFGGAIKYMVSGGAALDKKIWQDFSTWGFDVLEGYGMTETAPMIAFTRPNNIIIGSPGQILPGAEVKITDGEITVKGLNVMQGYFNRPDETTDVIKNGWLHTGDMGFIDKKGLLYITGRIKEIIVLSNGKNINPVEIEDKICELSPMIKEVGVYAESDQLRAILVPDFTLFDSDNLEEIENTLRWELIDKYNQSASTYKRIMLFSLYNDDLPRTRLSKLKRFKLPELGKQRSSYHKKNRSEKVDSKEYQLIKSYIEQEKNCTIAPSDHIELDLGLDSLDKVGLIAYLEATFGVKLENEELVKFPSILALVEHVSKVRTRLADEKINWSKILKEKVSLSLPKTWFTGVLFVKLTKYFFKWYVRLKGEGLKNVPDGPCIIAPNHQSYFDGLFVASFLKKKIFQNTYFYAKEKHVSSKWLKFIAHRHHIIIMDLNKDLKSSIQKMGEALKEKKNLIIFPEGTRTKDGYLGEFKKTFAILSRELNIPIIPVSIKGAYDVLPRGARFPKPFKKVSVEFLEPIYPGTDSYEKLSATVHSRIFNNLKPIA